MVRKVIISLIIAIVSIALTVFVTDTLHSGRLELKQKGNRVKLNVLMHHTEEYYKAHEYPPNDLDSLVDWAIANSSLNKNFNVPDHVGYLVVDRHSCIFLSFESSAYSILTYMNLQKHHTKTMFDSGRGIVHYEYCPSDDS